MGNENSKNKELTKGGKINEKHKNGSANGLSANITSNGLEIAVNGETAVQQNGEALSLNLATDSSEPDFIVIETDSKPAEAPVISKIPETVIQKEEVKENKEAPTDVSIPASDPQPESSSSGEDAAAMIVSVHREDFEYPHRKAEISTQTDRKMQADISTQTGEDDDDTTTNTEGQYVEEVIVMETAATEYQLSESLVVIAEEVVEDTAKEEPLTNPTAGVIIEEVILENDVHENIVFRAERVEVTDAKNSDLVEKHMNGCEETEPEIAAEAESNPSKSIMENEAVAEGDNIEETAPFEVSFSLPKVVADCVEAVFAAASESIDFAAVNKSEPSAEELITEGNSEGAGDMAADIALIETTEPGSNATTPEAGEANGVPSPDEEPETTVMEAISEVACEEPDFSPANQEELCVPLVIVLPVKAESAHEEVIADDAVAAEDVPGRHEQKQLTDEPSEKCDSCTKEENISVEAASHVLVTNDELPKDNLSSPDDEVKPEFIPEVIYTIENGKVGDVKTDVELERIDGAEPSPVVVQKHAEMIMETVATEDLLKELVVIAEEVVEETNIEHLANQTANQEELSIPPVTDLLVKVDYVHEDITTDDMVAVKDVPELREEKQFDDQPSEMCDSCPDEEIITIETPSNELITIEELPEDILSSLLAVITTNENAEVGEDVKSDLGPHRVEEAEPSPVIVKDDAEEDLPKESAVVMAEGVVEETNKEHLVNQIANQEKLSVPLVPEVLVKVESAHEEITTNDEVAVEDVPGIHKELDNDPLRNCDSCHVKEIFIAKTPSDELITIEELSEDKLSFFPEFVITDENAGVAEDVKTDAEPEMAKEALPSPFIVKDNAEVITQAATDAVIITTEELPKDTLSSPDDEVKPESIPEVVTTNVNIEVYEDVETDVGLQRIQEADPSPIIAGDDTEVIMEAAIDALSREFELCAITHPQESLNIPLDEEVIAATNFVPLSTGQGVSLAIPEEPGDTAAVEMTKEAIEALSTETVAVPESVEEKTTGGEELEVEVAGFEELMEQHYMSEEKTEVCLEVMAQTESSETPEQIPVISDEPVEENPNPCEEDATTEVLENIPESVVEAISAKPEVTENTVNKPADVPLTDTTEESLLCVSAQLVELVEESVTPAEVLLKDTEEGTAFEIVERVEQTDSTLAISNERLENACVLGRTLKNDVRVVIVKTIEVREEITEEILHDHTGAVLSAIVVNPEDATSDELECSEAVLETIVEEIIREDVVEAECNLLTSEEVAPGGKTEESESSVNSTDSTTHSQSVTSTDMEALVDRLQSACVSVVEESVYRLGGLKLSSLGHRVTVNINVTPKEEQT